MKKLILLGAAFVMMFSACNSTGSKKMGSFNDSLAYHIGQSIGQNVKAEDSTLNVNMIAQGIKDVFSGKNVVSAADLEAFFNEYYTVRKPAETKAAAAKFLADAEAQPNAKKTESGIVYEIITEGAEKPTAENIVKVVYHGTLASGKVFDSSKERGDTVEFALNQVIPGWSEGMQLVGKGGKIKLWIPSELGYGEMGNRGIAPNEALAFEVELIDVLPALPAAPAPAVK